MLRRCKIEADITGFWLEHQHLTKGLSVVEPRDVLSVARFLRAGIGAVAVTSIDLQLE